MTREKFAAKWNKLAKQELRNLTSYDGVSGLYSRFWEVHLSQGEVWETVLEKLIGCCDSLYHLKHYRTVAKRTGKLPLLLARVDLVASGKVLEASSLQELKELLDLIPTGCSVRDQVIAKMDQPLAQAGY